MMTQHFSFHAIMDPYIFLFLLQVDSANKHGILLEMVQVLTDLDLVISKSYISSDGGWFMDGQCPLPTHPTTKSYFNMSFLN